MKKKRLCSSIRVIAMMALIFLLTGIRGLAQNFETPKENLTTNIDFINGSFEEPNIFEEFGSDWRWKTLTEVEGYLYNFVPMAQVPGWRTRVVDQANAGNAYASYIEIDRTGFAGTYSHHGFQFAELNANVPGILYQTHTTTPGQKLYWEFYHKGRDGVDKMEFLLNDELIREAWTDNTGWKRYYGTYVVKENQTEFAFKSAGSSTGSLSMGNFLDSIRLFNPSFLELEKSVETVGSDENGSYALIGERVVYTVIIRNTGEAETSRTRLIDVLPAGTAYVEDSVVMTYTDSNGIAQDVNTTGLVSYDNISNTLSVEAGLEITGAVITDDNTDQEIPNTDANGTRSIARDSEVIITFEALVTGESLLPGARIENQAKAVYNDLGFEKYNAASNGEIEDEYNVSNVTGFWLRDRVGLSIEKSLLTAAARQESFTFRVDYRMTALEPLHNTFYTVVPVDDGDWSNMVTLSGLRPGYYTITELDSNWKYNISVPADISQSLLLNDSINTGTLLFLNEYNQASWINGKDEIANRMN